MNMSNTAVDGILAAVAFHEKGEAEAKRKVSLAYAKYRTATANGNHCSKLRRDWLELRRLEDFHAKSIVSLREIAHERLFSEASTQLVDANLRSCELRTLDLVAVRDWVEPRRSLFVRATAWIAGQFDVAKWFPRLF